MGNVQELIEAPLSSEELAARYRALCDDLMQRSTYAVDLAGLFA